MSEETNQPIEPTEMDLLKERAKTMGISHSNNISTEALKKKIEAKKEGTLDAKDEVEDKSTKSEEPKAETMQQIRERVLKDAMKLIRIRVTNLDPKKKDLLGEIFTIANEFIGNVTKYIPYGEQSEEGYHVPYCIYEQLKSRKFLNIRPPIKGKGLAPTQTLAQEFGIEVLPPLTAEELDKLRTAQTVAGQ